MGLVAIVLVHLAINVVHGQAHVGARVALSPAAAAFVYLVILAGPVAGLAMSFWRPVSGAWIVAVSFAGSLVFGLINHFIIAGADRVDHVASDWRTLFGISAALLLVSEAAGVIVGIRSAIAAGSRRTS